MCRVDGFPVHASTQLKYYFIKGRGVKFSSTVGIGSTSASSAAARNTGFGEVRAPLVMVVDAGPAVPVDSAGSSSRVAC